MKKTYSKPEILFENFASANSIAATCAIEANSSYGVCPYVLRTGDTVFMSSVSACSTHEDDGEYNTICYNVPSENSNLFGS